MHTVGAYEAKTHLPKLLDRVARGETVTQFQELSGGTSHLTQRSSTLHFGLGGADHVEELRIRWTSGIEQTFRNIPADQIIRVVESTKGTKWMAIRGRATKDPQQERSSADKLLQSPH